MTTTEALLAVEPENARIYYSRVSRHVLKQIGSHYPPDNDARLTHLRREHNAENDGRYPLYTL